MSQAKELSQEGVLKATDLGRKIKSRLSAAGCLIEILKGWYLLTSPGGRGGSTAWFGGFWPFIKYYLSDRFGKTGYCLSAESSLNLYAGESIIANQITVITQKNSNQTIQLPHNTSLFLYADSKNFPSVIEQIQGVNVMPLALALCRLSPAYYSNKPLNVEIALRLLPSMTEVSRLLLDTQAVTSANRLVGVLQTLGELNKSKQIAEDMASVGLVLKSSNPFSAYEPFIQGPQRITSPYAGRIEALCKKMRAPILKFFPEETGLSKKENKALKKIKELYSRDAYHSLSIEGYQVTEDLINKIAQGNWDPNNNPQDKQQKDALAAKGYYEAFQRVTESIQKVFQQQKSAGEIFEDDLQTWYRKLFLPLVQANLLKAASLAGYRNHPVFISNSRHIPPPVNAVVDSMETLFKLLKQEKSAAVRAILGHFIFVYIHPYMDGNGRVARFLMNLMLTSGGYPWTVIRVEKRESYMQALEEASVNENIIPFTKFVASEMKYWTEQGV
ncbi:MAG: Fic family protein [Deltaproteobacteria bacterium]|nr:Fic family protein [Deltaproteobacteria bacterium]